MPCPGFKNLMAWQADQMRAAIELDKLDLSRKAGHDVGQQIAQTHHLNNFLSIDAENWRQHYCGDLCLHHSTCHLGRTMIDRGGKN